MGFAIETLAEVVFARPDTELAVVFTCTGPKSRRSDAHMEVIKTLWDSKHPNVDVIVSNKRSKYAALCAFYEVDLVMCVGFPWLLPTNLVSDKRIKFGVINFHNSQLPKLRGPNALGHAIMNGDTTLHYVVHRMDANFDTGPILVRREAYLGVNASLDGVYFPHSIMAEMVHEALDMVKAGAPGEPQSGECTQAPKFSPEFRWIDFATESALHAHNKVRAHYGARDIPKGALANIGGETICITKTLVDIDDDGENSEVNKNCFVQHQVLPGTVVAAPIAEDKNTFAIQCRDSKVLHVLEWHKEENSNDDRSESCLKK